jgi:hypothetical protein
LIEGQIRCASQPAPRAISDQNWLSFLRIGANKGLIGFVRSEMTASFDHAQ